MEDQIALLNGNTGQTGTTPVAVLISIPVTGPDLIATSQTGPEPVAIPISIPVTGPDLIATSQTGPEPVAIPISIPVTGPDLIATSQMGPEPVAIPISSPPIGPDLIGTEKDDILLGDGLIRRILGRQGKDSLFGGSADELLAGEEGKDTVKGNGGNDVILGGQGDDLAEGNDGNDIIFGEQGNDTLDGGIGNDLVSGNQGNDLVIGGSGIDTINGGKGKDTIIAGESSDEISGDIGDDSAEGGSGNDTIKGGEGNDTCQGGDDDDDISGNAGDDHVEGGRGKDRIKGGQGNDIVDGGSDDDNLDCGEGNDSAIGGEGNDTVSAGAGNDTVDGGAGDDSIDAGAGDDSLGCGEGNDTVSAGAGNDTVDAGAGDDSLACGDDNDTVSAGAGNDTVDGGAGDDSLACDDGNDTVSAGAGNDTVDAGAGDDSLACDDGNDTVSAGAGNDTVDGGAGDDSLACDDGNDTVDGGAGDDSLACDDGNDTVSAGAGNDTVDGGAGDDSLACDDGNDTVSAGAGNDTVDAGAGDDSLACDDGNDTVSAGAGNDTADGGAGDDSLACGDGNDTVSAGAGNDTVDGGAGDDSVSAGDGNDTVSAGAGNDTVNAGAGDDTVSAGAGNDTADGGQGNDVVQGGSGDSTLMGGDGNDTIKGGTGNHTCMGGRGDDYFQIDNTTAPAGSSVISDYDPNTDKFLLTNGLQFNNLNFVQVGNNTQIKVNNIVLGVINNITVNQITVNNFLQIDGNGGTTTPPTPATPTPTPTPAQIPVPNSQPIAINENKGKNVAPGQKRPITSSELNYGSSNLSEQVIYTVTELPKNGKILLNGQPITSGGTFSQADVNAGKLSFEGSSEVTSELLSSFVFRVFNGVSFLFNQQFELGVFQNSFNFANATTPQVINATPIDNDIEGGEKDDKIKGNKGKDKIKGDKGKDKIDGGDNSDAIEGGDDEDELTGGPGSDRFVYTTKGQGGKLGDILADFDIKEDRLQFSSSAFGNLKNESFLSTIITAATESVGSSSLLIFDTEFESTEKIKETLEKLGAGKRAVFCVFRDKEGGSKLVYALDSQIEIIANFKTVVNLSLNNFIFTNDGEDINEGSGSGASLEGNSGKKDRFIFNQPSQDSEKGDTIVNFDPKEDVLQFDSSTFGNINLGNLKSANVSDNTASVNTANLLIFASPIPTLGALRARLKQIGADEKPVFCVFTDFQGQSSLVFADGKRLEFVAKFDKTVNLNTSNFVFTPPEINKLEPSAGDDSVEAGPGVDRIKFSKPREEQNKGVKIKDFDAQKDQLEFDSASFGNLSNGDFSSFTVTASTTSVGSSSLLIFEEKFRNLAALQNRVNKLKIGNRPTFCLYEDEETGESVLVFSVGSRIEIVSKFTTKLILSASNFIFTGQAVSQPQATVGNDNLDLSNYPSPLIIDALAGDDSIIGTVFDDSIVGNAGKDTLDGGGKDDTLVGNGGADLLKGGPGNDFFVYRKADEGSDKIVDFQTGQDKLQFSTADFGNITKDNFDPILVSGTTTDVTDKELLIFTGKFDSLGDLDQKLMLLPGLGQRATFSLYQNSAGEAVLAFDGDGTGPNPLVEIANLGSSVTVGTGVADLSPLDFTFYGSAAAPVANSSIVDLLAGSTYPAPFDFSSAPGGYAWTSPLQFSGDNNPNYVTGTDFADILAGNGNNDVLVGRTGNDTIEGGDGSDSLVGGPGTDSLHGDVGDDTLWGGTGADYLNGGLGADLFIYNNIGEGDDTITDFKPGSDKLNFVASAFGNMTTANFDPVVGTAPDITGKELVIFSEGTFASFADAQAKITGTGTTPAFYIYTNAKSERVLVFDGNGTAPGGDSTIANLGLSTIGTADFVFSGTVAAISSFNSIVDLVAGSTYPSAFNDFSSAPGGYAWSSPLMFSGDNNPNYVTGTDFADILSGLGGADILLGRAGDDSINGGDGDDSLAGGPGSDSLLGNAGIDTLWGGTGADYLNGGIGADIFIYNNPGEGDDTIAQFEQGVDKLNFVASAFGNMTTANFDIVVGTAPDITGKELVLLEGTSASFVDAQSKVTGTGTTPAFYVYVNAKSERVLVFDGNGTAPGGDSTIANLGPNWVGTADFVFSGTIPAMPFNSIVDLVAGSTYASPFDFSSAPGGYAWSSPLMFSGDNNPNYVTGTDFADILSGLGGADILLGRAGDDSINGGEGDDSLAGGPGSDSLLGNAGIDTLWGGTGADYLNGGIGADLFIYNNPGEGDDTIGQFEPGVDKLNFVASAFGNMTTANFDIVGGSGPDITGKELVLLEGTSASFVDAQSKVTGKGTTPAFYVYVNANSERILVFDGNGTAPGGYSTIANLGASSIGTADFVFTGTIPATPFSSTVDLVAGGTYPSAFNDFSSAAGGYAWTSPVQFVGDNSSNVVIGTTFPDMLAGEGGDDSLYGGLGGDNLQGGSGADLLQGGSGPDVILGGPGKDIFVYGAPSEGKDTLGDFAEDDDILRFTSVTFGGFTSVNGIVANTTSVDILGKNFINFTDSTAVTSLSLAENQYGLQKSAAGPAFLLYKSDGATILAFDGNGTTPGGGFEIANFGPAIPTASQFTFL